MGFDSGFSLFMCLLTLLAAVIWTLIIERFWFMRWGIRSALQALQRDGCGMEHQADVDRREGNRLMLVADLNRMNALLPTLIQVAPVMGLLGTVTAMIEIFRALSVGILSITSLLPALSGACLTTLMGMLIAVPTWVFLRFLNRERQRLYSEVTSF